MRSPNYYGAGHVGDKEIANYLIGTGSRVTLYVLTMLGKTDLVKPVYFDLLTKLKHYRKDGPKVFIDPKGYKDFVDDAENTFNKALEKQQKAA